MAQSVIISGRPVVTSDRWLKLACVHDEVWTEGQVVAEPVQFIRQLKASGLEADIFTFCQKLPETQPKYDYHFDWDNAAAIPLSTYDDWWEKRLPQVTRKNVRRALKRGVVVKTVNLDDQLLTDIVAIFKECPYREGKRFPHFDKDVETIKKEVTTILDRCIFIGAYHGDELIGFIKLVVMGPITSVLYILSKTSHYDKRPTNALISKAVEVSLAQGSSFLIYGKFAYGKKSVGSLVDFKRRNGFEQIDFPRYYIPLSLKGRIALKFRLHRGILGLLPQSAILFFINLRSRMVRIRTKLRPGHGKHNPQED